MDEVEALAKLEEAEKLLLAARLAVATAAKAISEIKDVPSER